MTEAFSEELNEHIAVMEMLHELAPVIDEAGQYWRKALEAGGKLLLLGNGGSAADAQHIAAEIVGRYLCERKALPAIALTTDTSILTAVANDYGYDAVFARQIDALATADDVVMVYSTSGNSANSCAAVVAAKARGCTTIALTGAGGGKLKTLVDLCLCVPSDSTPRIQEAHAFIGHRLCAVIDDIALDSRD
ncbi:MAG: SIS domain-containing protein [Cellvibrionaceae bacterium]|nr:SIS domain-containing protein [Cellvibrionaceae bacterium]